VSSIVYVPWITTAPAKPSPNAALIASARPNRSQNDSEAPGLFAISCIVSATPASSRPGTAASGSEADRPVPLRRCYERHGDVIDALFDLADAIITVRWLICGAWTLYR